MFARLGRDLRNSPRSTPANIPPFRRDPCPGPFDASMTNPLQDNRLIRFQAQLQSNYLADEIAGMWRGMMVVLPEPFWKQKFAPLTPGELARSLRELAGRADLSKYRKRRPSPKQAERQRPCQPGSHVSTARVLEEAKRKLKC